MVIKREGGRWGGGSSQSPYRGGGVLNVLTPLKRWDTTGFTLS